MEFFFIFITGDPILNPNILSKKKTQNVTLNSVVVDSYEVIFGSYISYNLAITFSCRFIDINTTPQKSVNVKSHYLGGQLK